MSTITEFANELYENSRAKGFYDHEDWLRTRLERTQEAYDAQTPDVQRSQYGSAYALEQDKTALAEHYGNRLLLIAGEAVEAHEELRAGRGVGELYFTTGRDDDPIHRDPFDELGSRLKPEGVLPELADVVIRALETMAGILANLDAEEVEALRGQVPPSKFTDAVSDGDPMNGPVPGPVNVAEILNLKHEFNLSRAPKHGGKAF